MSFSLSHGKKLDVGDLGLLDEQLPPWQEGPIDLKAWFAPEGHDRPLELEIGSGKGTFLIRQAKQSPLVNFVGVEYAKAYWCYAADRCRRHGLTNAMLVRAEAHFFVRNYVPDACLRRVHLYFPDPWPKRRHHKRRLIQGSFLGQLHRTMKPAAEVRIVTDHFKYYDWIVSKAQRAGHLFEHLPWGNLTGMTRGDLVDTNFERKYRLESRPLYAMILRKR